MVEEQTPIQAYRWSVRIELMSPLFPGSDVHDRNVLSCSPSEDGCAVIVTGRASGRSGNAQVVISVADLEAAGHKWPQLVDERLQGAMKS